ncbi:MAG: family efflux transporter subunit [Gemmatimonadetes bacterium]|nr:family efflux transporter subunit [Gemmatimonadota bacterium]
MDIQRAPQSQKKKYIAWGVGLLGIVAVTVGVSKMKPAAPTVEMGTLWIDTVRRGDMVREVRAPGTLVPEHVRIIAAVTAGRVEALPLRAGVAVMPGTVIASLSNPDVQLQLLQADGQLAAAEGAYQSLRGNFEQQRLGQEGAVATIHTQQQDALRAVRVAEALDAKGLSSASELAAARDRAAELKTREDVERRRLALIGEATERELALSRASVERLRAIVVFNRQRVEAMNVTAGEPGLLQSLPLELGQWVNPGMELARVAQPGRLKAVLHVPETQAKDVVIGQRTQVDTRNGIVQGSVIRIDPSSQNGTVTVEVALEGALPKGARADLTVDGTIEIERLKNVLYVKRPAYGNPESAMSLFRLEPGDKEATRASVRMGRASVSTIEVVQGLAVGDRVIVSDMSNWETHPRVRIR